MRLSRKDESRRVVPKNGTTLRYPPCTIRFALAPVFHQYTCFLEVAYVRADHQCAVVQGVCGDKDIGIVVRASIRSQG